MRGPIILLVLSVTAVACSYGTRIADFRPAHSPHGVNVHVTTSVGDLNGELIEMRDAGFVVLTAASNKLRLIPYAQVRSAKFEQVGSLRGGRPPVPTDGERLRLLSRFPQGMSPQVLATLLRIYGQDELLGIQ
ncbi:MAG TPA: hypothetical protein VNJ03_07040 [Vicinamibacterales bacterium]|nr:hypothetical protein [Vicinamibacterales bacterium]